MKTWIRRLAVALVVMGVLAVLAVGGTWWALRSSLPVLDGEARLAGLPAPVRVERDALGIATVHAADGDAAARALGFLHAQDRYFEMDLMRRMAAGELSALFGARALESDRRTRVDRLRARSRDALATLPDGDRRRLLAYTEGVQAGLAALRARPWPYLLLRQEPAPWRAEDSLLVVYAMYYDLQDASAKQERLRARAARVLPPALAALLMHDGSRWDAPLQGTVRGDAPLPGPDAVNLHALARAGGTVAVQPPERGIGSNNFAVSGALTADGRAIVADDMHLKLRAPNIWFRARLRYADAGAPGGRVDVSGFSLPGVPGIVVGSNGHVAWGFTNSYGDWVDWIRLPDCRRARCAGRRVVEERIEVAGADAVTLRVEDTAWGPIGHYERGGTALARRWVAHLPGSANMGLLRMDRAGSVEDALEVADRSGLPAQNLVVGDRSGRIAWRLVGAVPQRAAGCVPGGISDAAACPPWGIRAAGAPAIVDPPAGRLWTANARVVDGAALARIGDGGYVTAVRARMIRDGLFAKSRFTERDLLAIQLDDRSLFLERWHALLAREAARPEAGVAVRALAAAAPRLEPRATREAVAYRLVRGWREAVHDRIADGLLAPARAALGGSAELPSLRQPEGVAWPIASTRPAHLLPARYRSWDALFEDAAREVRIRLETQGPLAQRTWGERNTAAICHPLAPAVPFMRDALCMPAEPLDGDTYTPRAQGPDMGASQRMVVSPGREAQGIAHMPGGQSGHPLSPFWGAGHADWVRGEPSPFLPGPARHTLVLRP